MNKTHAEQKRHAAQRAWERFGFTQQDIKKIEENINARAEGVHFIDNENRGRFAKIICAYRGMLVPIVWNNTHNRIQTLLPPECVNKDMTITMYRAEKSYTTVYADGDGFGKGLFDGGNQ